MNRTVWLSCLCAAAAALMCAQEYRGTITGIVTDASNSSLPNCKVQVTNLETTSTFNVETGASA